MTPLIEVILNVTVVLAVLFIYLFIETTKELHYSSAEWGNNSSQMSWTGFIQASF